jgi:hypothetical protein
MKLIHWLFSACLFTASFDIFLVFNLGGTIRFAQLIMLLVCLGALAKAAMEGRVLWPAGGTWLALWFVLQVSFLPLSVDLAFGVRYLAFLFYTLACFYAVVHLYGRSSFLELLMKAYLGSYVFIAVFGIFQLVSPSLHLGSYFVTQWILHGVIPRINGFCYEPSYYATYLFMGWITLVDLRASKAKLTAGRKWYWLTLLVGGALFLSTSKTAWLFMIIEGCARGIPFLLQWMKSIFRRLSRGDLRIKLPRWRFFFAALFMVVTIAKSLTALNNTIDLNIFLAGSGLNNSASHSVSIRADQFRETVMVFKEHPFIGLSLGGVSSRLAQIHGIVNDGKTYLGFPVIMDLLAASGVIGIIPLLLFLGINTVGMIKPIRRQWPDERAKWLRALVRATIYELLILSVDQNVLRLYVWFHLSIAAAVALHLRYESRLCPREKNLLSNILTRQELHASSGMAS